MIGNVSISIHELLAVARESEGVKAVKGDVILCEKRFAPDTRYMVEFLLLEQKEWYGEKGVDTWFVPEENTAPKWSVRNFPMEKWEIYRKWCGV